MPILFLVTFILFIITAILFCLYCIFRTTQLREMVCYFLILHSGNKDINLDLESEFALV